MDQDQKQVVAQLREIQLSFVSFDKCVLLSKLKHMKDHIARQDTLSNTNRDLGGYKFPQLIETLLKRIFATKLLGEKIDWVKIQKAITGALKIGQGEEPSIQQGITTAEGRFIALASKPGNFIEPYNQVEILEINVN